MVMWVSLLEYPCTKIFGGAAREIGKHFFEPSTAAVESMEVKGLDLDSFLPLGEKELGGFTPTR